MARYRVRYVSYAAEQMSQLPRSLRTAFDARVEDLKRDPYVAGDYDERTGSYSTTFGEAGIILYTVSDEIVTVTIIRVNWVKW
jgi:mRNA-degrading endonuclease RelE of RelBE toxin-antitoxin system